MLLGKLAFHNAGTKVSALMKKLDIDFILPRSTMKQTGIRDFLEMKYDGKKLDFSLDGKALKDIKDYTYTMPAKDVKVSFGIYDGVAKNINKNARLAKQLGDNISGDQLPPEVIKDYVSFLESRFSGSSPVNKEFENLLSSTKLNQKNAKETDKQFRKRIDDALDRLLGKDFEKFSSLGLKHINDGMKENTPVGRAFRERARSRIMRTSSRGLEDDFIEIFKEGGEDVTPLVSSAMRWLNISDGTDAMTFSKIAKNTWDKAISSYLVKRVVSPKVPYSNKAIMRIYDLGLY